MTISDAVKILEGSLVAGDAMSDRQVGLPVASDLMSDVLLVDAVAIPGTDIHQVPIIKGDAKSLSIGAASIIAKVTRDRMMRELDDIYPEYGFAGHKGYGTAAHIAALKEFGPCPIHRRSFITHFI